MPKNDSGSEKQARTGRGIAHLHLFTLSGLAIAQPIFDLLSRHAEFFVVRRSSPADLLVLVLCLLLLPLPAVLVQATVARFVPRLFSGLQALFVTFLVTLFLLQLAKVAGFDSGHVTVTACALAAVGVALAYLRWPALGRFLTYLSISLVIIPGTFLLHPQISKLMQRGEGEAVASAVEAETPVFIILFDELVLSSLLEAKDRIDAQRYPNLAAFSERALWFENAMTVSDSTHLAVPAILTGTFPDPDKLPTYEDYSQNLFTLLGNSYSIWADEPVTSLCPPKLNRLDQQRLPWQSRLGSLLSDVAIVFGHQVLPSAYARHLPPISQTWGGFGGSGDSQSGPAVGNTPEPSTAEDPEEKDFVEVARVALRKDRVAVFQRFLDAVAAEPEVEQHLYFMHAMLPHAPWEYLPSGKKYLRTQVDGLEKNVWTQDELPIRQGYQRYLLQLEFLDRLVGRFLSALEERNIFERSLIVLLSDHGASFVPGEPRRKLTEVNAPDILPMLLLVKPPGLQAGEIRSDPVSSLDVLPTIADVLKLTVPNPLEGRSLLDSADDQPSTSRVIYPDRSVADYDPGIFEAKFATLQWKLDHFGAGPERYRTGSQPEIHGRSVASFETVDAADMTLHLDSALLFADVDKEAAVSLSRITGALWLAEADDDCCEVAVAINGTIEATTRTFGESKSRQFSALVPDASFRDGANKVEVAVIDDSGSPIRLRRLLTEENPEAKLLLGSSGQIETLIVDERRIPVHKKHLRGRIEGFRRIGDQVLIRGWAASTEAKVAAGSVQLYYEERLISTVSNFRPRPDIARRFDAPSLEKVGFLFEVPSALLPNAERNGVRIVAVASHGGAATELAPAYRFEEDATGGRILATNGTVFSLAAPGLSGSYRLAEPPLDDRWKIEIRAHPTSQDHRPHKFIAFHDGALLGVKSLAFPVARTESDGGAKHQQITTRSTVPRRGRAASEVMNLRLFAITRSGVAAELRWLPHRLDSVVEASQ